MAASFRKIGAWLLFSIFFFNAVLFYACMGLLDLKLKAEIAYVVKHSPKNKVEFDILNISPNSTSLKEISFDGNIYDIIKATPKGKTIHIVAIKDIAEGNLFSKVVDHIIKETSGKGKNMPGAAGKGVLKITAQYYTACTICNINSIETFRVSTSAYFDIYTCEVFQGVILPPPKV